MAKDPAFLFYPGDYLRDTQCLSESVQVAYDRIMCEHMRNICISQQQLNFFTKKLSPDEIAELKMVLTEVDGGYQIEWVASSILKRKSYSESRSKNRQGNKKHMKNISDTYVQHMENEIVNENEIEVVTEKKTRSKFSAPEYSEIESFMKERNAVAGGVWPADKVVTEAKKYYNYYQSNGWRVGKNPMKDWQAAARNWMNNANQFTTQTNGKQQIESELDNYRKRNGEILRGAFGQRSGDVDPQ